MGPDDFSRSIPKGVLSSSHAGDGKLAHHPPWSLSRGDPLQGARWRRDKRRGKTQRLGKKLDLPGESRSFEKLGESPMICFSGHLRVPLGVKIAIKICHSLDFLPGPGHKPGRFLELPSLSVLPCGHACGKPCWLLARGPTQDMLRAQPGPHRRDSLTPGRPPSARMSPTTAGHWQLPPLPWRSRA